LTEGIWRRSFSINGLTCFFPKVKSLKISSTGFYPGAIRASIFFVGPRIHPSEEDAMENLASYFIRGKKIVWLPILPQPPRRNGGMLEFNSNRELESNDI
jgi:hypothetical protein